MSIQEQMTAAKIDKYPNFLQVYWTIDDGIPTRHLWLDMELDFDALFSHNAFHSKEECEKYEEAGNEPN